MILPPAHPNYDPAPEPRISTGPAKAERPIGVSGVLAIVSFAATVAFALLLLVPSILFVLAFPAFVLAGCAWAWNLARNYWVPVLVELWVPWCGNMWVVSSLSFMLIFDVIDMGDEFFYIAMLLGVIPTMTVIAAFSLRSCRADTVLLFSILPPAVLFVLGGAAIIYSLVNPGLNSYGAITLIGIGCMLIACAQILPPAAALAYLKFKGLYGTTPQVDALCVKCRYDLTGSAMAGQATCPECGAPIAVSQVEWIKNRARASEQAIPQEKAVPD